MERRYQQGKDRRYNERDEAVDEKEIVFKKFVAKPKQGAESSQEVWKRLHDGTPEIMETGKRSRFIGNS